MPISIPPDPSDGTVAPASWGDNVRDTLIFLTNPPACRVYNNAAISVADSTVVTPAFNSERYDTDSMHDTVTNNSRITFNTAGLYLVSLMVEWAPATYDYMSAGILLNGGSLLALASSYTAAGVYGNQMTTTTVYKFAVGDYVQGRVYQDNAANVARNIQVVGNYSPEFAATWIGLG